MIGLDKLYHFGAGIIISIVVSILFDSPLYGFISGGLAGVAKEAYDQYSYGGADYVDFYFTLGGAAVGVFVFSLIDIFI